MFDPCINTHHKASWWIAETLKGIIVLRRESHDPVPVPFLPYQQHMSSTFRYLGRKTCSHSPHPRKSEHYFIS